MVERGIENPCVGGSSPSLATLFNTMSRRFRLVAGLSALVFSGACGDRCDTLCAELSRRLAECRGDELTWADLGARNRADFAQGCRSDWERQRADLDGWEIELALIECGDAHEVLDELTCDEVRALYAP